MVKNLTTPRQAICSYFVGVKLDRTKMVRIL